MNEILMSLKKEIIMQCLTSLVCNICLWYKLLEFFHTITLHTFIFHFLTYFKIFL